MTNEILILLIAFQIKHLIADYYLQFPYMYENKGKPTDPFNNEWIWFRPLFDHAGIHALFTFIILYIAGITRLIDITILLIVFMSFIDLSTHFAIDRWKATQKGGPDTAKFWQYLGIDQMLHHLVGIFIIWTIV